MAELLLTIVFLSGLLAAAAAASSPPPSSSLCQNASYRCGHRVLIQYPFWLDTGSASSCGYIRLECRRGSPVLPLPSGDYRVDTINYGDRSSDDVAVTVVDLALDQNVDRSCPNVAGSKNLTLPAGSPLSLTDADTFLNFYVGCRFSGQTAARLVRCQDTADGLRHTYVFRDDDNILMPYVPSQLCDVVVHVPVLRRSFTNTKGALLEAVMPAIKAGFALRWRPAEGGECAHCEERGGFCGFKGRVKADHDGVFKCYNAAPPANSSGGWTIYMYLGYILLPLIFLLGCLGVLMVNFSMCGPGFEQRDPEGEELTSLVHED